MSSDAIIDLYERRSPEYDRDRARSLSERHWLERFLAHVPPSGTVLDLGCGMGEPIARFVLERGYRVFGVDSAPSMIRLCRERFPEAEWLVADMRDVALGRRFDGVMAWDSFFHLDMDDQRAMFGRFAAHASYGAPLMFTSGPSAGEAIGCYHGEPLYHASLAPEEYRQLLEMNGFTIQAFKPDDPEGGDHTVWLATWEGAPQPGGVEGGE